MTMKLSILVLAASGFINVAAAAQPAPASCPVTLPDGGYYANDALGATLYNILFRPGGPGFVDHDGALGIKFGFERLRPGRLFVGGRRLDGEAGPARAYIYDYGDIGFQPIYLLFPMPGCWEITGGLGDATLTFVLSVEKIGDGPSSRQNGPLPGRRVATHWREQ
jgi:hypothetical protein